VVGGAGVAQGTREDLVFGVGGEGGVGRERLLSEGDAWVEIGNEDAAPVGGAEQGA